MSHKRAFVTGGHGFIGSHVVHQLLESGWDVAVLSRHDSDPRRLQDVASSIRSISFDGKSVASFESEFKSFGPRAVFHLGWEGVSNTFRDDMVHVTQNLPFAIQFAKLSAESNVDCWIGAGSQAEYGPKSELITEQDLPNPTSLYGVAKLSTGLIVQRIAIQNGMRFGWLRIFSTYGPDDNPIWMIPSLISTLMKGAYPKLTAGQQMWDYLHVDDAARAFIALANSEASGIFNLGSGIAYPLRQIIEWVRDAIDPSLPLGLGEVPYRSDQVMVLHADISRLRDATNWTPQIPLRDGLCRLIEWHRSQLSSSRHDPP